MRLLHSLTLFRKNLFEEDKILDQFPLEVLLHLQEQKLSLHRLVLKSNPGALQVLHPLDVLFGQLVLELGDQHKGELHILNLDVGVNLNVPHLLHGLHDDPDVVQVKNLKWKYL